MGEKIKFVIILSTALLLFSCHSEYLSLDYSIHHGGCISADSSFAFFVLTTKAYRQATGISRFPDGGIPDYIMSDMGIYSLNMNERSLEKIVDLKDLAALIGSTRSLWKISLNTSGDSVMYKVQPVSDWSLYNSGSPKKQDKINEIREKYESVHIYDIQTKEIRVSSDITEVICPENQKMGIMDISRILKKIPLSEMGFVLRDIYPKTDEEYIDETIYCKNNSEVTRRAVVEHIISKLSKDEITGLLKNMDEYKESLESLERNLYDLHSKDTYDSIKDLIRVWTDIIFYDVSRFDHTVFVRLSEQEKVTVNIFPFSGKSKDEFLKYPRPKKLRVTKLSGIHADGFVSETATVYKGLEFNDPVIIDLEDSHRIQSFEIDLTLKEIENISRLAENKFTQEFGLEIVDKCIALKIEVTDVYPGTDYQNTCISEVFTGEFYESEGSLKVSDLFVNDDENAILAVIVDDKEIEVYSDPASVLQLAEVSQNKKWAIIISMPAEIEGRAETEYFLIDVTKGQVLNENIGALSGGMMYFGKPWAGLETLNFTGKDNDQKKIYLK